MRNVGLKTLGLLVVIAATILSANAQARTWTQAGMLRCRLNPSIGFVIFGHQSMECAFQPVSGPVQAYEGAINTVGLDLGVTEGGGLAWAVFGPRSGAPLRRTDGRLRWGICRRRRGNWRERAGWWVKSQNRLATGIA